MANRFALQVLATFVSLILSLSLVGCSGEKTLETLGMQGQADTAAPAFNSMNLKLTVSKNACAANVAQDYFKLQNADTVSVPLSSISIKYWINDTSGARIVPNVWYGGCVTSSNGTCVHQVSGVTATATQFAACGADPTQQANWEITVKTTDTALLNPSFTWSGVQTAVNRSDSLPFSPGSASWYSSCGVGQPYAPDSHFAVYVGDNLVFSNGVTAPSCRAPHGTQQLSGYFGAPPNPAVAPVAGPVDPSTVISLDVGLPVRDPAGLQAFIDDVSNFNSPNYRHYKSVSEFTATWGANPADYQALSTWAQAAGFTIVRTFPNNLLLTLSGTARTVEQAFFTNLVYRLRADGSKFVAVDREPSLNLAVPLLHVSGLSDFFVVAPKVIAGTSTGGNYWGDDLRNAYLGGGSPCSALTGQGQTVGIVAPGQFNAGDVAAFDAALFPPRPTGDVSVVSLASPSNQDQLESVTDVEMVNAMAPAAKILVFQGSGGITAHGDSIFHAMATDGRLTIVSNSWSWGWNASSEQAISEMAAEGISVFDASGDGGDAQEAQDQSVEFQNQTIVGGTDLEVKPLVQGPPNPVYPRPYYDSETAFGGDGGVLDRSDQDCWPWPNCQSAPRGIPGYQQAVDMSTNHGSTQFRNSPDVAGIARDVAIVSNGKIITGALGTSFAAPFWAGFMALANEQSVKNGLGRVGFANPVLYAIGLTRSQPVPNAYSLAFNDITRGFNTNFHAVAGYDLVTGWGSPKCGLITQLANNSPTTPSTFSELQVLIGNGDDGLRDNSSATLDVLAPDGSLVQTFTLKAQDAPGWDGKGLVHDSIFAFDNPLTSDAIGSLTLNLQEHFSSPDGPDNWSIDLFEARLLNGAGPEFCLSDHTDNNPLYRLTSSHLSQTIQTGGGCSVAVNPPAPNPDIEFSIQTGSDGLREDSEAQATIFFADGTSQFFELKLQGDTSWDPAFNAQNLRLTLNSSAAIDHIVLNKAQHPSGLEGDDNWDVEGVNITTFPLGGLVTCQIDASGDPAVHLTGSAPSVTLVPRTGCP
jgi:hypothetical protein